MGGGGGIHTTKLKNCPYSPQIKHGTVRCVSDGYETSVVHNISLTSNLCKSHSFKS